MATGDRVLPIYSGDETDLYFQVDGGDIYKEGDVDRDAFSGDLTVKAGSTNREPGSGTSFSTSYWDANKGDWDQEALKTADNWSGVVIVSGDKADSDYMGAFEGCVNFTSTTDKNAPKIYGAHTVDFFKDCSSFDSNLAKWDFSEILESDGMFDGCTSLSDDNFRETLLKMNKDKNEAITVDNPQYIGAAEVVITNFNTYTLIDEMFKVGQIVFGHDDSGVIFPSQLEMNNEEVYDTTDFDFEGNFKRDVRIDEQLSRV
jgi:hypothetical protein